MLIPNKPRAATMLVSKALSSCSLPLSCGAEEIGDMMPLPGLVDIPAEFKAVHAAFRQSFWEVILFSCTFSPHTNICISQSVGLWSLFCAMPPTTGSVPVVGRQCNLFPPGGGDILWTGFCSVLGKQMFWIQKQ